MAAIYRMVVAKIYRKRGGNFNEDPDIGKSIYSAHESPPFD